MSSWFTPSLGSIRYVSAECSRGKTLAACKYMASKLSFSNFLYVAPTKRLLHQTLAALQELGVSPTLIDSDTTPKRVNAAIINYLKDGTRLRRRAARHLERLRASLLLPPA